MPPELVSWPICLADSTLDLLILPWFGLYFKIILDVWHGTILAVNYFILVLTESIAEVKFTEVLKSASLLEDQSKRLRTRDGCWSTVGPTLAELVHTGTVNAAAALVGPAESAGGRLRQWMRPFLLGVMNSWSNVTFCNSATVRAIATGVWSS